MTYTETDPDSLAATHDNTAPEDALADAVSSLPDTHPVTFTMKMRGGAYDRLEVDKFMGNLSQAIADVRAAVPDVQEELAALRAENAELRGSGADSDDEITAGAVGLLTQAQLIADKAVADAERYARDLVLTARNQYREILERAESSAGQATAALPAQHSSSRPRDRVRTYLRPGRTDPVALGPRGTHRAGRPPRQPASGRSRTRRAARPRRRPGGRTRLGAFHL